MKERLLRIAYHSHPLCWLLWPFSLVFQLGTCLRRFFLTRFLQQSSPVPIIVVGNLTVGGVGKTPLVIALVNALQNKGIRVGVVSRGYRATIQHFPHEISPTDDPIIVGDEPFLIHSKTLCPVIIAPKRTEAIQYLLQQHPNCQIILSDDGLQHYAMGRSIEIAVIDGVKGLGNGLHLPAGPLREGASRLKQVDLIVINGKATHPSLQTLNLKEAHYMAVQPGRLTHLLTKTEVDLPAANTRIAAVAAIGNPERFFQTLANMDMNATPYVFPDHHRFTAVDFTMQADILIMTEKDAVKCLTFAKESWYFLPVTTELSPPFWDALWSHETLKRIIKQ